MKKKFSHQKLPVKILSSILCVIIISCSTSSNAIEDEISMVESPETSQKNQHYFSNRVPLQPSVLIKLPIGAIKPAGWLKEYLFRQRNGLTGNLGKISAWLQKEDNAWLDKDGKGDWALVGIIGDLGKKIHLGRSRNDLLNLKFG